MNSRILQGRYLLQHEIGSGGMGAVHLGVSIGEAGFRRRVAVKRLRACYAHDPRLRAFFVDEARLAGYVEHANVVATLDVVSEGGELFLVMDYVAGETLAALFRDSAGCTPASIAAALLVDALQGLHAIHEARGRDGKPLGLVHRDVSPHNVMAGLDGVGYVLDFGIARPSSDSDETRNDDAGGKLAYMAPETLLFGEVTRRSDVYAAGLVLWEALVGRRFRSGASAADLILQAHRGDVTAPSAHALRLPPGLDEVVLKACAREPADRYASAFEMAAAIEAACPLATRTSVGAWVRELAGEAIERRAACDVHAAATVMPPASNDRLTVPAPGARSSSSSFAVPAPSPSACEEVRADELIEGSLSSLAFGLLPRRGLLQPTDPEEDTRLHTRRSPTASKPQVRSTEPPRTHQAASPRLPGWGPYDAPSPESYRQEMKVVARHAEAQMSLPQLLATVRHTAGSSAPAVAASGWPLKVPSMPFSTQAVLSGPPVSSAILPNPFAMPVLLSGPVAFAAPTPTLLAASSLPPGAAAEPAPPSATTAGPAATAPAETMARTVAAAAPAGPAATAGPAPGSLVTSTSPRRQAMPTRLAASLAALKAVVVQEQRREIDSLSGLHYGADDSTGSAAARPSAGAGLLRSSPAAADAPRSRALGFAAAALAAAAMASVVVGKSGGDVRSAAQGGRTFDGTLAEGAPRIDLAPMGREFVAPSGDAAAREGANPAASEPAAPPVAPTLPPASTLPAVATPAPTAAPIVASPAAPAPNAAVAPRGVMPPSGAVVNPSGVSGAKRQAATKAPADGCDPPVIIDANGNRYLKPSCTDRDD